jgi:REP element-mobilizing transposase RayT
MFNYRRTWCPGGTYFFTLNLLQRSDNDLLVRHIALFRDAVRTVRLAHPFTIHAWVVLSEHMHCVIEMPMGDADFAVRWRLIKIRFSKSLPAQDGALRHGCVVAKITDIFAECCVDYGRRAATHDSCRGGQLRGCATLRNANCLRNQVVFMG